jgi:hypothetical protein
VGDDKSSCVSRSRLATTPATRTVRRDGAGSVALLKTKGPWRIGEQVVERLVAGIENAALDEAAAD